MKDYLAKDEWKIVEDQFHAEYNQITESIMSLGNGRFGQRANMPEHYSGHTLQGNYVAGVYYPDKTRVGWWKNGYPEYFAKVLNAVNWIGLDLMAQGHRIDLGHTGRVSNFYRSLDMKGGTLSRKCTYITDHGKLVIDTQRFISMAQKELGIQKYSILSKDFEGILDIHPFLDFDVVNQDSNYGHSFWEERKVESTPNILYVEAETLKTKFVVGAASKIEIRINGKVVTPTLQCTTDTKYAAVHTDLVINAGDQVEITKYAIIQSNRYVSEEEVNNFCAEAVTEASQNTYEWHLAKHEAAWQSIWDLCDIKIDGDVSAQQGIRFNIFQLFQTYTGDDERLNIGPKGFTGEKYGGSTYWDTEAYCLPFYLGTADPTIARNLLIYRYKHLEKAIENAEKLGFTNGAALYPMVTINGEECHNEWEITFEEIHRNGAIAYAIYDYVRYTGDKDYVKQYGLEVLVGIARFWAQRVHLSPAKAKYVMLGVTGPNEYENNINNNWYTNYIATWCLQYALESIADVSANDASRWKELSQKLNLNDTELKHWQDIIDRMYYPTDESRGIVLQQDGFLDKEDLTVSDLRPQDRPLNQKWSWDRILRSPYIKQADVLQGMYFFEDHFDKETIRRNFEYYEPKTVHESSLSPCVHAILACSLGMEEKAYEMYLRTSRLDLDDYNNDTEDGCHITSMAGTWLSVIKGFAGQRVKDGILSFETALPKQWKSLSFKMLYRGTLISIDINHDRTEVKRLDGPEMTVNLNGKVLKV